MHTKYGEIRSFWGVALGLLAMFVGGILGMLAPMSLFGVRELIELVVLMGAFTLVYRGRPRDLGLHRKGAFRCLALGSGLALVQMTLMWIVLTISGNATFSSDWTTIGRASIWLALGQFFLVGLYEETFTRGYFMTVLKPSRNLLVIMVVPALLFGLMHAANPGASPLAVLNISLDGLCMGYALIRTGSLWLPVGAHAIWNFLEGSVFGFPVSGITLSSVMQTTVQGPVWITGGSFGPEGGIITTVAELLGFLFIAVVVPKAATPVWRFDRGFPLIEHIPATV